MNEQLRHALADAAGVDPDSPNAAIGGALLLPESTRNEPAPGYRITAQIDADVLPKLYALFSGEGPAVLASFDRAFLVRQSWHDFRKIDDRKWVLA